MRHEQWSRCTQRLLQKKSDCSDCGGAIAALPEEVRIAQRGPLHGRGQGTWPDPYWQLVHISNGHDSFRDPTHNDYITGMPAAYSRVRISKLKRRKKNWPSIDSARCGRRPAEARAPQPTWSSSVPGMDRRRKSQEFKQKIPSLNRHTAAASAVMSACVFTVSGRQGNTAQKIANVHAVWAAYGKVHEAW